jgi:hypothetical protein
MLKDMYTSRNEEMAASECTRSHEQAIKMRSFSEEGRLSRDVIHSIMQEKKPNQVAQFKMPHDGFENDSSDYPRDVAENS